MFFINDNNPLKQEKAIMYNWDEKRYEEYQEDIEIAICAIADAMLFPTGIILYDLYAIPSHNHQAYYAIVYESNGKYEMVYARTEIYTRHFSEPIIMYPFSDAKAAEKHPASDGRIIMGTKRLKVDFMSVLDDIAESIPAGRYLGEHLIVIDGVFQAMRVFNNSTVTKEIVYREAEKILIQPEKAYLIEIMDNMYLTIERIITEY